MFIYDETWFGDQSGQSEIDVEIKNAPIRLEATVRITQHNLTGMLIMWAVSEVSKFSPEQAKCCHNDPPKKKKTLKTTTCEVNTTNFGTANSPGVGCVSTDPPPAHI